MKRAFIYLAAAILVVSPFVACAQTTDTSVQATVTASTTRPKVPPLPKVGPAIRNIASTTRAELKNSASTTRDIIKAKVGAIHELIAGKKEDMRERADAAKERAKERFGVNVERHVSAIVERLGKAVEALERTATRLEAHIDRRKEGGLAMEASITALAAANTAIAAAEDKVVAANTVLEAALGSADAKAEMDKVRAAVKAAEEALRAAKQSLQNVITSVRIEVSAGATTTVTTD
jgi:hypothetical protein